jgi:hypothetical protein
VGTGIQAGEIIMKQLGPVLVNVCGIGVIAASFLGAILNYGDGPMNDPALLPIAVLLFGVAIVIAVYADRRHRRHQQEMDEKWRKLREAGWEWKLVRNNPAEGRNPKA